MKKKLTFEQAITRLEDIIQALNSGEAPLEESLALYKESAELLDFCNKTLEKAKLTIEEILPQPKESDEEIEKEEMPFDEPF